MLDLVWLVPALPLAGFLILVVLGRRMGEPGAGWLATAMCGGAFVASAIVMAGLIGEQGENRRHLLTLFEWIEVGGFRVEVGFLADPLSITMALFITGIGTLIHLYSISYMHGDPKFSKFFIYMNLFVFSMLMLVLGSNMLVTFLGWEGVGACSYLLIAFWFSKDANASAGKKAFVTNRIGDWGFMCAMFLTFATVGSLDYSVVLEQAPRIAPATATAIALLLFLGACGKSAQLPLFVWLPDAMAGPTPVSALIHAATMVTAGVYLMTRVSPILTQSYDWAPSIIAWVGVITALFAATIALAQTDIKKVLAYSTVSQLGFMFLAIGSGAYVAAIFHMITHAFFKALLFLGSGAVIHALGGEQDLRRMGGLRKDLPITYWTFLIGSIAIAGVPGLAGFFSKDEILYKTFASGHTVLWVVGLITSAMTAVYMFRLVFLAFHGERRGGEAAGHGHGHGGGHHLHDAPPAMALALIVLAVGSVVAGYAGFPHALGGSNALETYLAPSLGARGERHAGAAPESSEAAGLAAEDHGPASGTEHGGGDTGTELALMGLSSLIAVGGIGVAAFFFLKNRQAADAVAASAGGLRTLLLNKYYVDELYDAAIVQPIKLASEEGLWKRVDAQLIDGVVNGTGGAVRSLSGWLRLLQTGSVRTYAASLLLGAVLILGYYLWS